MKITRLFIPLIGGLALLWALLAAVGQAGAQDLAVADAAVQEASLNPAGSAYELNRDDQGQLWISDFDANEIWHVNPASGAYTIYQGIQAPSDARRDAAGYLWWGDGLAGRFGRLNPASGQANLWDVPNGAAMFGTQFDDGGRFWVATYFERWVYRFDQSTATLCSYVIPAKGTADYPLYDAGFLWLGDNFNSRMLRLNPATNQLTSWDLPADAYPGGMAFDGQGTLWYPDSNNGELARFWPDANKVDRYTLPTGLWPQMVVVQGERIWYSEDWDPTIGRLVPDLAAYVSQAVTPTTTTATPTCTQISPAVTETVTIDTGTLTWGNNTYPVASEGEGWRILELPLTAFPWGMANSGGNIYAVDSGRQVLIRMPVPPEIIACKVEDADGDPNTTGDQTPVANWPLHLIEDGVRQQPAKLTGVDGCASWPDLSAGTSYGIYEQLSNGWTNLAPLTHTFGTVANGALYQHTFANSQYASVKACKVEDADGDVNTTDDRSPVQGWTIDVRVNGQAQSLNQSTGQDGCTTFSDLLPGETYGLVETLDSGWTNLTPLTIDFAAAQSGDAFEHTFVNSQEVSVTACKVEDADGNLNTSNDRSPVQNWAIDLRLDGVAQAITQTTGIDGCTTWSGLLPGPAYGAAEEVPPGWASLNGATVDFAASTSGDTFNHTFINSEGVSVTACKFEDADGNLATTGDQTPVQNWTIDLRQNGVAQNQKQNTGLDGCTTWGALAPGLAYGVVEEVPPGWLALNGTTKDFTIAGSGDSFSHTFVNSQEVSVTACKVEDGDGDINTTNDRSPVQGWSIDLREDGVAQELSQSTGIDGCTTWSGLAPGPEYGVVETVPAGWLALDATTNDFAASTSGDSFNHTFVNSQYVSVKACKVEDADGDVNTTDDRSPVQGWTIDLRVNGQAQGLNQSTGQDGCTTFSNLLPGETYGLVETLDSGWTNLTPLTIEFAAAQSGDAFEHTFVNSQEVSVTACKVEDADGDLNTSNDRSPVQNWAIDLRLDGVAQAITQTTGIDGCTTWSGLVPGPAYGAAEEVPPGWASLNGATFDFADSTSGDTFNHTFINSEEVTVTACKVEDVDGNLATTNDQTPVQNWTIDLRRNSVAQNQKQNTGLDGCTTWSGLAPGSIYGVAEEVPTGWVPLNGTTKDFTIAGSGDSFSHTFVNSREVTVTACKVEDADGDINTTGDRSPVQGWSIDLREDGVAQELSQSTGVDGCTTWSGLAPGPEYGVVETVPSSWLALDATTEDFAASTSGDSFSHTFVNFKLATVIGCKLRDADGNLNTTDDQTPLSGWTLYLTADNVRQSGKNTTGNGCATWTGLEPGKSYGLEEDLSGDWTALTPTDHTFGEPTSGATFSYTFINYSETFVEDYFVYLPLVLNP